MSIAQQLTAGQCFGHLSTIEWQAKDKRSTKNIDTFYRTQQICFALSLSHIHTTVVLETLDTRQIAYQKYNHYDCRVDLLPGRCCMRSVCASGGHVGRVAVPLWQYSLYSYLYPKSDLLPKRVASRTNACEWTVCSGNLPERPTRSDHDKAKQYGALSFN